MRLITRPVCPALCICQPAFADVDLFIAGRSFKIVPVKGKCLQRLWFRTRDNLIRIATGSGITEHLKLMKSERCDPAYQQSTVWCSRLAKWTISRRTLSMFFSSILDVTKAFIGEGITTSLFGRAPIPNRAPVFLVQAPMLPRRLAVRYPFLCKIRLRISSLSTCHFSEHIIRRKARWIV